jgi:hypothetical protein
MAQIVPPDYQAMVDWCTQPVPEFRGDMNVLQFYLINAQPDSSPVNMVTYHGYLFWKVVAPATSSRPRGVMDGFGRVIGNLAYATRGFEPAVHQPPNDWVRVRMSLTPSYAMVGVDWLNSGGDGFPSETAFGLEWDLPTDPGPPVPPVGFDLKHSETGQLEWQFNIRRTTLMF